MRFLRQMQQLVCKVGLTAWLLPALNASPAFSGLRSDAIRSQSGFQPPFTLNSFPPAGLQDDPPTISNALGHVPPTAFHSANSFRPASQPPQIPTVAQMSQPYDKSMPILHAVLPHSSRRPVRDLNAPEESNPNQQTSFEKFGNIPHHSEDGRSQQAPSEFTESTSDPSVLPTLKSVLPADIWGKDWTRPRANLLKKHQLTQPFLQELQRLYDITPIASNNGIHRIQPYPIQVYTWIELIDEIQVTRAASRLATNKSGLKALNAGRDELLKLLSWIWWYHSALLQETAGVSHDEAQGNLFFWLYKMFFCPGPDEGFPVNGLYSKPWNEFSGIQGFDQSQVFFLEYFLTGKDFLDRSAIGLIALWYKRLGHQLWKGKSFGDEQAFINKLINAIHSHLALVPLLVRR